MYMPLHFAELRPDQLQRVITEYPLGALVTNGPDGLDANHLPFHFEPSSASHGVLTGHVARANPLWQTTTAGSEVMVIFRGPTAYVSPSWYPSKHEAHRQVPTWNYIVVHAHGRITIHDDERFVRGLVARLTRTHEAGETKPWKMGDSTPEFIDMMLRSIVGIEIEVTRLTGKWKLSQNKEARDREGAARELAARGHQELADEMLAALRQG